MPFWVCLFLDGLQDSRVQWHVSCSITMQSQARGPQDVRAPLRTGRGDVNGLQVVLSNRLYFRWSGEGVWAVSSRMVSVSSSVAVQDAAQQCLVPRMLSMQNTAVAAAPVCLRLQW